jgi:hypothetical protein
VDGGDAIREGCAAMMGRSGERDRMERRDALDGNGGG